MLTPLATSMLALLCERPMHCYEMYREMLRRHEDRIVKVKPGSLYHTMDRLAAAELVVAEGTDRDGARPERTTYAVTDAGRAALHGWVRTALAEPVNEYPRLPVALAESRHLPRADVLDLVQTRVARLEELLAADEQGVATAHDHGVVEAHLVDAHFLMDMTRAELGWLRRLADRLEREDLAWPIER